ncbi:MAG: hypothetical protein JWM56_287 [Candidatus Peribacteria bacterium]|nr:hypothetical protein [Candidatus Peribacteria bacterium]
MQGATADGLPAIGPVALGTTGALLDTIINFYIKISNGRAIVWVIVLRTNRRYANYSQTKSKEENGGCMAGFHRKFWE